MMMMMTTTTTRLVVIFCIFLTLFFNSITILAFYSPSPCLKPSCSSHGMILQMGLADALKKAFANDVNLPPATNPGLTGGPRDTVEVEFLPAKVTVKALPGQRLSVVAQAAKVPIRYKCNKGECGTCTVRFNGIPTKVCQASIPTFGTEKKYTIVIPTK